jgi:hypothetical protein
MRKRYARLLGLLAGVFAVAAGATTAVAVTSGTTTVTPAGHPAVYQDVYQGFAAEKSIPLALRGSATDVLNTPALPAGTYLVHYSIGVVMGPNENIICAASPLSGGPGNDGNFATAGNGATESGSGAGGVYANASTVDVWHITKGGDQIAVWCAHTNAGGSSYASGGSIVATPVETWTKNTQ